LKVIFNISFTTVSVYCFSPKCFTANKSYLWVSTRDNHAFSNNFTQIKNQYLLWITRKTGDRNQHVYLSKPNFRLGPWVKSQKTRDVTGLLPHPSLPPVIVSSKSPFYVAYSAAICALTDCNALDMNIQHRHKRELL